MVPTTTSAADRALARRRKSPLSMDEEINTGDNLPAQIDLSADDGDEYHFLFIAKGGGLWRSHSQGRKTKRPLRAGAGQIRVDRQLDGRNGAQPHGSAISPRPRRRSAIHTSGVSCQADMARRPPFFAI